MQDVFVKLIAMGLDASLMIFVKLVAMGLDASLMILAVMLFRVFFRKAPRWIVCLLWMLAGIRLVCPFHIESAISLIPDWSQILSANAGSDSVKSEYGTIDTYMGRKPLEGGDGAVYGNSGAPAKEAMADAGRKASVAAGGLFGPGSRMLRAFTMIWLIGMVAMLFYLAGSCLYIRKKISTATYLRENIWESEFVGSPFIFGLARPRIYVPYHMDAEQLPYILAHEHAHLERKDHIWKAIAFLICSAYWFHPLVWAGSILFYRDIELACDEKAVLFMDAQEKKEYLLALLSCSVKKGRAGAYPLAFGEIGVKERVIHMKKFKKPSFVLTAIALLAGVVICACLLTSPKGQGVEGKAAGKAETGVGAASSQSAKGRQDGSDLLEIKQASVDLSGNTGADGAMLYYADAQKIIFGGYFGLFVYGRGSGRIESSLDLEYIGCNDTQGDHYCEIAVDKDGQRVYLNPLGSKKLYTLDLLSSTLEVRDYESNIWTDSALELFHTQDAKRASYLNGEAERVCGLHETNGIIGNLTYFEYDSKDPEGESKAIYYPLFLPENSRKPSGFGPEDMQGIVKVQMRINGVMQEATDGAACEKLEKMLSSASKFQGSPDCPFYESLYITLADGETGLIWPATDSCHVFRSEKGYFEMEEGADGQFWELLGSWRGQPSM